LVCYLLVPTHVRCLCLGGRITKEALKETIECLDISSMSVYICGPQPMIQYISDSLMGLGVNTGQVHFEKWWWLFPVLNSVYNYNYQ